MLQPSFARLLAETSYKRVRSRMMKPSCPSCGSENVSTWSWKHPLVIHWILNPGLAFNEVVLGQRLPSRSYVCRDCKKDLPDRNWVICPHCAGVSTARLWMGNHALGHWLGVVCPHCGMRMPSLWNATSAVLVICLSPMWVLPYFLFKDRYLAWEAKRAAKALSKINGSETAEWPDFEKFIHRL